MLKQRIKYHISEVQSVNFLFLSGKKTSLEFQHEATILTQPSYIRMLPRDMQQMASYLGIAHSMQSIVVLFIIGHYKYALEQPNNATNIQLTCQLSLTHAA